MLDKGIASPKGFHKALLAILMPYAETAHFQVAQCSGYPAGAGGMLGGICCPQSVQFLYLHRPFGLL